MFLRMVTKVVFQPLFEAYSCAMYQHTEREQEETHRETVRQRQRVGEEEISCYINLRSLEASFSASKHWFSVCPVPHAVKCLQQETDYKIMNILRTWKTKHRMDINYSFTIHSVFTCLLIILDPEISQQRLQKQTEPITRENKSSVCFSMPAAFNSSTFNNTLTFCAQTL